MCSSQLLLLQFLSRGSQGPKVLVIVSLRIWIKNIAFHCTPSWSVLSHQFPLLHLLLEMSNAYDVSLGYSNNPTACDSVTGRREWATQVWHPFLRDSSTCSYTTQGCLMDVKTSPYRRILGTRQQYYHMAHFLGRMWDHLIQIPLKTQPWITLSHHRDSEFGLGQGYIQGMVVVTVKWSLPHKCKRISRHIGSLGPLDPLVYEGLSLWGQSIWF